MTSPGFYIMLMIIFLSQSFRYASFHVDLIGSLIVVIPVKNVRTFAAEAQFSWEKDTASFCIDNSSVYTTLSISELVLLGISFDNNWNLSGVLANALTISL